MEHLHSAVLYRSSLVSVTDVRCRPHDGACSREEHATHHQVVFPRTGVFVKHVGGRAVVADPNHVLFFNANEPYRVSHPVPGGDDCTTLVFEPAVLADALERFELAARDRPDLPFRLTHGPIESPTLARPHLLRRRLRAGDWTALEIDELALESLAAALGDVWRARTSAPPHEHRTATERQRREWVAATQLLVAGRPEADLPLAAIARAVACSPFHLTRLFRAAMGAPIHRYRLRLRLALALERITDSAATLSRVAFDLGFSSHSHFTRTFRRTFGLSPERYRRSASERRARELRRALQV